MFVKTSAAFLDAETNKHVVSLSSCRIVGRVQLHLRGGISKPIRVLTPHIDIAVVERLAETAATKNVEIYSQQLPKYISSPLLL